jgi:HlyD family secretion protein
MTRRSKIIIGVAVLGVVGAAAYGTYRFRRHEDKEVTVEAVRHRDLTAVVSASGKIDPKRSVNISADVMGRVTDLAVNEGDIVAKGQFLLQIDPRNLQSALQRGEAGLAAAQSQLTQMHASVVTARENLALARETLKRQQELWAGGLTTRENLDKAETDVKVREAALREVEQQLSTQDQRIRQERAGVASARYDLSKVRIESPIDGIVTRRNIEQGEMVVIGTMNNAGTVMLTIADMSVIEAEVEVDETDIPSIKLGQVAKVTIDALPDKEFRGKVTEIGNSPIQSSTSQQTSAGQQATNFKVTVTLDERIPGVRPGFTCTAEVTTDTRTNVLAVPIQAMAVRELIYDQAGHIVQPPKDQKKSGNTVEAVAAAEPLPRGQTRKETEGVFVLEDTTVRFVPVKTGIAGDKYFEVTSGLKEGQRVVTGPFTSVRDLAEGDRVKLEQPKKKPS